MGESIWCNVQFRVPSGWNSTIKPMIEALYAEYDSDPDPILEGVTCWSVSGEGNYGFEDGDWQSVLGWLAEWHVPYVAQSDAKYEIPGMIEVHDGYTSISGEADGDGAVLSQRAWEAIWKNVCETDGSVAEAIDHFFKRLNVNVDHFDISTLSPWPPPDKDEALTVDECEEAGVDGTLRAC